MEGRVMGLCLLALGMLGFAASAMVSRNDLSCEQALTYVLPCGSYLDGSGGATPSTECCSGVKQVLSEATTTPIRRDLCECFKEFVGAVGDDVTAKLQSIPKLCQLTFPVPLDPKIDCSTVPS